MADIPVEVLIAWGKKDHTHYYNKWAEGSNNIFSTNTKYRYIKEIGITDQVKSFTVEGTGCAPSILKLEGFIEFYNQFYKLDTQPVAKLFNPSSKSVYLKDEVHSIKIQQALIDLGCKWTSSGIKIMTGENYVTQWVHVDADNIIIRTDKRDLYPTIITDQDLKINKNNTPLNTKTDGKIIIVSRPVARVQRGQRPEGYRVSGKTSKSTVSGRHISYRTISS